MPSPYLPLLLLVLLLSSCRKENRETTVYGKVIDDQGRVLAEVPVSVFGQKKWTLTSSKTIATAYTDSMGRYRTAFIPDKNYAQFMVEIDYNQYPLLSNYKTVRFETAGYCCPIAVGAIREYNFTLVTK